MIRQATQEDFDPLCDLLRKAHEEKSNYSETPYNEDIAKHSIRTFMEHPGAVVLLLERDGIQGVFAGVINPEWWHMGKTAIQLFWYVVPEHRGSGWMLVRAFERWARKQPGVDRVMCGNSFSDDDRVDKLFLKLGYEKFNTNYYRGV